MQYDSGGCDISPGFFRTAILGEVVSLDKRETFTRVEVGAITIVRDKSYSESIWCVVPNDLKVVGGALVKEAIVSIEGDLRTISRNMPLANEGDDPQTYPSKEVIATRVQVTGVNLKDLPF
jgi:hypothetical protein